MPLVHEDDRARVAASLERVHEPPHTSQHEGRALTADGWRWLSWVARGVLGEEGQVESVIGVGRDITEQKPFRMATLAEQLRQVLGET